MQRVRETIGTTRTNIEPYRFEGVDKLIKDFYSDIQRYREEIL